MTPSAVQIDSPYKYRTIFFAPTLGKQSPCDAFDRVAMAVEHSDIIRMRSARLLAVVKRFGAHPDRDGPSSLQRHSEDHTSIVLAGRGVDAFGGHCDLRAATGALRRSLMRFSRAAVESRWRKPDQDAEAEMNTRPFLIGDGWVEVLDGNDSCRALFDRHYSRYFYADGRKPKLFVGPGEKLVLLHARAEAFCAWRKFNSADGQQGVNCAVFRNESAARASALLESAMGLAWTRWPGERLYTYVDPAGVAPTHRASRPTWGHCFYQAGWRFSGLKKRRLHILEVFPT